MPIDGLERHIERVRRVASGPGLGSLPGPMTGGTLADDLVRLVAEHHIARSAAERGPAGAWLPLSRAYLARKAREGYPARIGVRTGEMLNERQFRSGPTSLDGTYLAVRYGATPGGVQKMRWFERLRPALGPDDGLRWTIFQAIRSALVAWGRRP
jgi:hypothetical protein